MSETFIGRLVSENLLFLGFPQRVYPRQRIIIQWSIARYVKRVLLTQV